MNLTDHRTLGRSGLVVSPLALGTMTFGAGRWGSDEKASRAIFDAYVGAGGNFVDTADIYAGGEGEAMLGRFIADRALRDRLIVATKSGWPRRPGTPTAGGNGAKNVRLSLETSLTRLGTDYVDLYWVHVWDRTTPPEEVLQTLSDTVRAGKILYYGFSNTPAWYVARIATLAQAHGLPAPIGLQYQYSLIDRGVELEIVPAGQELGLGLVPWSPLGAGLLTGKYDRSMIERAGPAGGMPDKGAEGSEPGGARLEGDNPFGGMLFTERNFAIVDALRGIADEAGRSMAEVALSWAVSRPGISSVLIGASRPEQVEQNIRSLDVELTAEQVETLNAASEIPAVNPYFIFRIPSEGIHGGSVTPWRAA